MNSKIEHAENVLACIDKMKEGLSELVALLDIQTIPSARWIGLKPTNPSTVPWVDGKKNMRASSMNKVRPSHRRCKERGEHHAVFR
jgi:hypothetical protein